MTAPETAAPITPAWQVWRATPETLDAARRCDRAAALRGARPLVLLAPDPAAPALNWDIPRLCRHLDWHVLLPDPPRLPSDWGAGWAWVWLGARARDQREADAARRFLAALPGQRFLLCAPLKGPIDLALPPLRCPACAGAGARGRDDGGACLMCETCLGSGYVTPAGLRRGLERIILPAGLAPGMVRGLPAASRSILFIETDVLTAS